MEKEIIEKFQKDIRIECDRLLIKPIYYKNRYESKRLESESKFQIKTYDFENKFVRVKELSSHTEGIIYFDKIAHVEEDIHKSVPNEKVYNITLKKRFCLVINRKKDENENRWVVEEIDS